MKRRPISLLIVLLTAAPVAAQTVNKEKLRAAAYLPKVSALVGIKFSAAEIEQHDADGKKSDFTAKIATLQKLLNGTVDDAAVYLDIAECYDFRIDEAKGLAAVRKAEELLRPHLHTTGPKGGRLLAHYCHALWLREDSPSKERENWARRAVELAPQDWRCWAELGCVRSEQCSTALYGSERPPPGPMENRLADLLRRNPKGEARAEAQKRLQEARRCYDKVRVLAPRDRQALIACFGFACTELAHKKILTTLPGQTMELRPSRDLPMVREVFALAELWPENMLCQAQAAMWELTLAMMKAAPEGPREAPDELPTIDAQGRQAVGKYLDRLARGTASPNAEAAAFCHTSLASLHALLQEAKTSEDHARRALELDAGLLEMWEFLEASLANRSQKIEAFEVAQARLKRFPTARNYFLLAKCLANCDRTKDAEQVLRQGLALDPRDVYCRLGLAAVLIWRSGEAPTLPEAGACIRIAMPMLSADSPPSLRRDFMALMIVLHGLEGGTEAPTPADLLRQLRRGEAETPELRKIREALGQGGSPR